MKDELLKYCYKFERQYIFDAGRKEFECLIALVEDETIKSYEDLAKYGMEYDE